MDELYCLGCGIKLQCEDENKEGYVDPKALNREFILCKRCYQLQHYGKFSKSLEVKNTIDLLHQSAKKNDLIILIADCALVYSPLNKVLKELNSFENVILVANHYDLYKDMIKMEKCMFFLKEAAKNANIHFKEIFILNNNIDEIFDYIDNHSIDKNAYLVGLENAGKTTFVNEILKNIANENKQLLTNSKYPGTTIDLVKINLDDNHYLIDSPGIKSKGNLLNYVELDFIKKVAPERKLKANMFNLNTYQSLLVSNLVKFDFIDGIKQSIIFTGSNKLEVIRSKYENSIKTFDSNMPFLKLKTNNITSYQNLVKSTIKIKDSGRHDIVIEGLGFFTVSSGTYQISTIKGLNVFVRKAML